MAVGLMAFVVKEKERKPVPHISFGESLRALPLRFRKFLVAVGLFGAGDFAHTLLILLAAAKTHADVGRGQSRERRDGVVCVAQCSLRGIRVHRGLAGGSFPQGTVAGWRLLPRGGDGGLRHAAALNVWTLALIFVLGGIYVAMEETLEDSFCAELVGEEHHGMAFGTLATVNGVGDFVSSLIVGLLWTVFGTTVAFGYSAVLFLTGAWMVWRLSRHSIA